MIDEYTLGQLEELNKLTPKEKEQAVKILKEYATEGKSQTMDKMLYEDYAEIPVDIHTFLHDRKYLGDALYDKEGKFTLYPFWEETLVKIFPNNIDTDYHNAILTGGIGIGKSTCAVIGMIYSLYRMLCLKDPQLHYGLQNNELISFVFVNMTLREAKGVMWAKFHNFVLQSQWFLEHGEMSRSIELPTWKPYNQSIELYPASTPSMLQGRAVFSCLDGETEIATLFGDFKIKDIIDKDIRVVSIDDDGKEIISDWCRVEPTVITDEQYEIELEDGTIIKCTPNHRFMLKDGTYKEAQYLTEDDEFFGFNKNTKIKSIVKRILDEPKQFYDVINANPYNNFLIKTNDGYVVSHNCAIDEVNFDARSIDIAKQKARAKKLVTEASNRLQSRFMKGVKNPTVLWLCSSKASDQSYLDEFIREKKEIESKTTIIIDEPQWIVRPDKDSPIKFPIAVGNQFMENALLPKNATKQEIQSYIDKGYQILMVPIGYWENFSQDLDGSLRDIAGISIGANSNFINGVRLNQCVYADIQNPFTKEIITVGNDSNDVQQYYNFFDLSLVPKDKMEKPLYIHLDLSMTGDKTGIAGSWIIGKRPTREGSIGSDLQFQLAFSVSVEAPKGRQISFEKTRTFIRWLREVGFNVKVVSADTFQSASTLQLLQADGFETQVISVDRVKDRQCIPYEFFRNALYEQRIKLYRTELLRNELIGLQKDNNTGKVDHQKNASKDQADAVAASIYSASQHGAEYAFNFGETLDTIIDVSQDEDTLQQSLRELPISSVISDVEKGYFKDFGTGLPVTPDTSYLLAREGILWL